MNQKIRNFHNPEYAQKKRKVMLWRSVIVCVCILLLIAGCAGLTHWSKVSIDTVTVNGTYVLSPDEIKTKTLEIISKNYGYIFNQKNALLYPKNELRDTLLHDYPRIKTIDIGLANYHTINIELTERQPKALWCDVPPRLTSIDVASSTDDVVSNCYFLDDTGFVYSHSPDFSGDAYFKYYGLVPYESPIGSTYLASPKPLAKGGLSAPDTFTQLSVFVSAVKALNITPLYIVAENQNNFTMYIYGGGKIIFDDTEPLSKTAEHLRLLLQTANLVPQKNGELLVEYIDLRYGNKLYYKVRQ